MRSLGVLGAAHAIQRSGARISAREKSSVKLVLFTRSGSADARPGLLTDEGIVDVSSVVQAGYTPQLTMERWIDEFERLRPQLAALLATAPRVPESQVRLLPPLPRPGKIACCIANYWEHAQR